MELSSDITSEDLDVFLQEAEEQLQLLDEAIVQMEQAGNDSQLLQEIFRAAHTIKVSSAMIGYAQMTELAHVMESLLDKVSKGTLAVSTPIVDALLHSVDLLREMKDSLTISPDGGHGADVDISRAMAELQAALAEGETGPQSPSKEHTDKITLSGDEDTRLLEALEAGQRAVFIDVSINEDSSWAVVRCFQVLNELSQIGELIASKPTQQEIEAETISHRIQIVLASQAGEPDIRGALDDIDDISGIDIRPFESEDSVRSDHVRDGGASGDASPRKGSQQSQTLRVDVERLDYLMNTIGELVIDRTRIQQISRLLKSKYRDEELVQALGETSAHVVKVVDELQQEIMKVRMLPIGTVFNGFPRMIRDLAQKFDKKVDFVVEGQDTEVDRTIVECLRDPLMHLLRNSVDHGIESPAVRKKAGKPETGTITLSAFHDQGHIVITVQDDGGGIDPEIVRGAAIKKGIISAEVASRLSDAESIDLIFMPGASTVEKATDISGRGVGMDVVKTNIEAINGFVHADTVLGQSTKFTMRLPLTLATLQALLVSSGQTTYAVPVIHVLETVRVAPEGISTIEGNEVIRLRENVVPLLRLNNAFRGYVTKDTQSDWTYVVVVRIGERLVGLGVDALVELQEIMIKSLGQFMDDIKGIAGASIMGDGRVVLILDVPTLVHTSIMKGSIDLPAVSPELEEKIRGAQNGTGNSQASSLTSGGSGEEFGSESSDTELVLVGETVGD